MLLLYHRHGMVAGECNELEKGHIRAQFIE
jgi:hypothetical protein